MSNIEIRNKFESPKGEMIKTGSLFRILFLELLVLFPAFALDGLRRVTGESFGFRVVGQIEFRRLSRSSCRTSPAGSPRRPPA